MLKIALSGACGRMGRVIADIVSRREDAEIVCGFDPLCQPYADFPIVSDPFDAKQQIDVVIDFSNAACTAHLLDFCVEKHIPVVLCTTGHSAEQLDYIRQAAAKIPILRSGNMSLGINLMRDLLRRTASVLGDGFDVEIVEKHHNQKLDAPSGTALMLADAVRDGLSAPAEYVYDRHERRMVRPKNEIGISAVRGGTIVGEHSVLFCGRDEIIEIRHTALSREVFAAGSVNAAVYLAAAKKPGMYDMGDVIASA